MSRKQVCYLFFILFSLVCFDGLITACSQKYTYTPTSPHQNFTNPTSTPTITATFTPTSLVTVTTMAGVPGTTGKNNGPGTNATFNTPFAVAVNTAGQVYVADGSNNLIRVIYPGSTVFTYAGSGSWYPSNGPALSAGFFVPWGVAVDPAGNVFVSDNGNNLIREITTGGTVSTLAGQAGVTGATNATGTLATFNSPFQLAVDSSDNVYVADNGNNLIRKITSAGVVTTLAGQAGVTGATNGTGTSATFNFPDGIAVDSSGNVYVGDGGNSLIRKITPGGVVTTLAGGAPAGPYGTIVNGQGTAASFGGPYLGVAVDGSGNVFVADSGNSVIRKIIPGGLVTTYAGTTLGYANGCGNVAQFDFPEGISVDSSENVYVADSGNDVVREIIP